MEKQMLIHWSRNSNLMAESLFQAPTTRLVPRLSLGKPAEMEPIASVCKEELSGGGVTTIFIFEELVTELEFFRERKLK